MKKYIEQEAAIELGKKQSCAGIIDGGDFCNISANMLRKIPAADVEEVRHAHWVECGDNQPISSDKVYCCSNCKGNKRLKHQFKPFCELCGAKMDGGSE